MRATLLPIVRSGCAKARIITSWLSMKDPIMIPKSNPTNVWLQTRRIGLSLVSRGRPLLTDPFSWTWKYTGLKSCFTRLHEHQDKLCLEFILCMEELPI